MQLTFGPYDAVAQIAVGSTGTVYQAWHRELGRVAAIKELNAVMRGVPGLLRRFKSEAEILAGLDDEHIVRLYDYVEEPDRAWIAEQWVDGASLREILAAHGRLSVEQSIGVIRGALLGLAHAHGRGLVHRDVSTSNIVADAAGTSMLIDFGLAAPTGETGVFGTPAYISPEAARGQPVGTSSDVYSAAAVLYTLLAGAPPFVGSATTSVLKAHAESPPPHLQGHGTHLRDLLSRCLDKDPALRPVDAAAFLAALEEAAEQRLGAGWLTRASIVGAVATTMAATGRAAGSARRPADSVGGVQAAPLVQIASVVTGPAIAAAAGVPSRAAKVRRLATRPVVAAAAAAVVVLAVVSVATAAGNRPDKSTEARPVVAKKSASPTPTPTPTPSPTLDPATTVPVGVYRLVSTVLTTSRPLVNGTVGTKFRNMWTFSEADCEGGICTGKIKSDSGRVIPFTWDGTQLVITAVPFPPEAGPCYYEGTSTPIPGSSIIRQRSQVSSPFTTSPAPSPTTSPTPSPTPSGSDAQEPPRKLFATVDQTTTFSDGRGACAGGDRTPVKQRFKHVLTKVEKPKVE